MDSKNSTDQRKLDHVNLAFKSITNESLLDQRFDYEPMLGHHPSEKDKLAINFLGHEFDFPIWISSMTGGGANLEHINRNLAMICRNFKLGFATGSCRPLFEDKKKYWNDFNWRDTLGNDRPFFTNLGIAQLHELKINRNHNQLNELLEELKVDGVVIHVNPLQEWFQVGGDRFTETPLETLNWLLDIKKKYKIIVKEVGQGMGPASLKSLVGLNVDAIEFAGFGGTNFSLVEKLRNCTTEDYQKEGFINVGHTCLEMAKMLKSFNDNNCDVKCKNYILSGGVKDYLDGYYLIKQFKNDNLYGLASTLLKYATSDYEKIHNFMKSHTSGLLMANNFLKVRGFIND
jgi:isopentenyl-diphosphate Delta-isomerase